MPWDTNMISDLALVTVLFGYPEHSMPKIYDNALKYFNESDIYINRTTIHDIDPSDYYGKLYMHKIVTHLPYMEKHILGKYKYTLFVDATDTNFYKIPVDIIDTFLTFDKSIVFCAEKELWPETRYTHMYANKIRTGPFQFLNSGVYIGYTEKIVEHLRDIVEKNYEGRVEDQSSWTIQYLLHDDIDIDSEGKLFFSTHRNKDYVELAENKNVVLRDINPYVVHDNGPYLDETIKLADLL